MLRKGVRPLLLLSLMLTVLVLQSTGLRLRAQVLYGSIVGNVTDQTGAVLPGVGITAVQQETNRTWRTMTGETGNFGLPTLQPGFFTVEVELPGFKEYIQRDVPVTLNSITRVDVVLQVGEVTETITVTSGATLLQTERADVYSELTEDKFENLPVTMGRNYQNLFKTLAGFSPPRGAHSIATNPSRSMTFSANGVSISTNSTRIDGATSTNPWLPHLTGYVPSLESIETVNVVSNSFDAEQGLAGGAAVSVQLKSGTNNFRGSAFFLHHDHALAAKQFLYPYPERLGKPKNVYNQWGGTIGGPILRDKLFFFASYEGTGNYRYANRLGTVPSPEVRRGDFSAFLPKYVIYDPLTGNPDGTGRQPFPGNVIPGDRIDSTALTVVNRIPEANVSGVSGGAFNNYLGEGRFTWDRWTLDTKVDWALTQRFNMFGRLSTLTYDVNMPTLFGAELVGSSLTTQGADWANPGTGEGTSYNFASGANYIFTPSFLVDGNLGFARFVTDARNPYYGQNVGQELLNIPGTNGPEDYQGGWPFFDLEGYDDYGNRAASHLPYWRQDDQWQYALNFSWLKGRHEFRWGLDLNRQDMNHIQSEGGSGRGPQGRFDFKANTVRLCVESDGEGGCRKLSRSESRLSFAGFLLGMPSRRGKSMLTETPYATRNWMTSFYFRDRWQVTPKFTVSLGTRWEYFPIPTRDGRGMERYDPSVDKVLMGGVGQVPTELGIQVRRSHFAPRIGLAFRLRDDFVVRAGYGITTDPYPLARAMRTNHPVFVELTEEGSDAWIPVGSLIEGIPPVPVPDLTSGIVDIESDVYAHTLQYPEFRRGYVQSWNLTLQKGLPGDFTIEVGYVATRQIRQLGRSELNYADIGTGEAGRQLYVQWGRTARTGWFGPVGSSHYDSMQVRLKRRFVDGLSWDVNYTWGKVISTAQGGYSDASLKVRIPEYYQLNRQVSPIDRTHNLQLASIWELPFGKGSRWLSNGPALVSALVSGWQVNNIVSLYTGRPFDVAQNAGILNAPDAGVQRPDQVGSIRKTGNIGLDTPYYEPAAFSKVTEQRYGTAGFGILREPGVFNWDFGLFRDFEITERVGLQFRMETFNFTNTPHYSTPYNSIDSSRFLAIDSGTNERQFRLGMRLQF